jgi:hypothetical protein
VDGDRHYGGEEGRKERVRVNGRRERRGRRVEDRWKGLRWNGKWAKE